MIEKDENPKENKEVFNVGSTCKYIIEVPEGDSVSNEMNNGRHFLWAGRVLILSIEKSSWV